MLREAIILAGGLGTRLRDTVSDLPKVLAPVNNQPFLYYLLANLFKQNLNHVVLSTGYMGEKIEEFIKKRYPEKNISIAKEEKPLGTGGGIFNALQFCNSDEILILNGDTFFNIDYNFFYHHHNHHFLFLIISKTLSSSLYRLSQTFLNFSSHLSIGVILDTSSL